MEVNDDSALVTRYKKLLSTLLLRRGIEGPLPDQEEAALAQDRADLWDEIEAAERPTLEDWIDNQMKNHEQPPECVASYVSRVREVAVLRAIRADGPAAAIESGLDESLSRMTAVEREFVGAWREREQALAPAQAHLQRLLVEESPDPRLHTPRQSAAA